MDEHLRDLVMLHAVATWYMVGLIWFVQVVHYPLMALVGAEKYTQYQTRHMRVTGWVVGPAMIIEVMTLALLSVSDLKEYDAFFIWGSGALLALIWCSTAFQQVPQHQRLLGGFNAEAHRRLVRSNWTRTIAWTFRGFLVTSLLF